MESPCSHVRTIVGCAALCLFLGGCRAAAPVHVWSPPKLASAVGTRVAIAPIRGDADIARRLGDAMRQKQPRDPGREVVAIDARQLEPDNKIRLVSAVEGDASDLALMTLAKRNDIDFILIGEVVSADSRRRPTSELPPEFAERVTGKIENSATDVAADQNGLIRVSWSLMDVRRGVPLSGMPVVTPGNPRDPDDDMIDLAVTAAWELVVPHIIRDHAELTAPRLSLGSKEIRRGNVAAAAGDWCTAEQIWLGVLRQHPNNHAAKHNLAVAAVARQDYVAARRYIAEALATRDLPLYRSTSVWIEQSQRDYHTAFAIPDPPGGWAATRR